MPHKRVGSGSPRPRAGRHGRERVLHRRRRQRIRGCSVQRVPCATSAFAGPRARQGFSREAATGEVARTGAHAQSAAIANRPVIHRMQVNHYIGLAGGTQDAPTRRA